MYCYNHNSSFPLPGECDPVSKKCEIHNGEMPKKSYFLVHWICDGEDDCGNGYDETNCGDCRHWSFVWEGLLIRISSFQIHWIIVAGNIRTVPMVRRFLEDSFATKISTVPMEKMRMNAVRQDLNILTSLFLKFLNHWTFLTKIVLLHSSSDSFSRESFH